MYPNAVFKVQQSLDLANFSTAFNYVRRFSDKGVSEITKQEYKNPKQVRDYWKKIQRAYRARKKQEKLEATAPAAKHEAVASDKTAPLRKTEGR